MAGQGTNWQPPPLPAHIEAALLDFHREHFPPVSLDTFMRNQAATLWKPAVPAQHASEPPASSDAPAAKGGNATNTGHGQDRHATKEGAHENAEDDGLGYYSDGEKRTLTDDQIAIFRHSEFQEVLRMARKLREMKDEGERVTLRFKKDKDGKRTLPISSILDHPLLLPSRYSTNTGLPKRKYRKGPKKDKKKGKKKDKPKAKDTIKHKLSHDDKHWTPRRIAREADNIISAAVELDY
ncbi:hypothetical protein BDY21DRAFT_337317 [Lineolata rhizophorae]|uniref:Uncharacterized protein n=1 Tax=Lineolata rhizophorae TaxID=578093 RepID=A0A6A6P8H5_9PEZI|nr:hypothetical protein BDY21DRAFT_337317 [Lineolata rhizophorae]